MDENQDSIDLDALSGIPSEELFDKLLNDPTFVDYFNTFLSLPVFGKRLCYDRRCDTFNIDPPPPRTCYHIPHLRVKKWVRRERMRFFWKTDLFLKYLLCVQLHDATDASNTSVDLDEARAFLGTVEDMCSFHVFLRGTAGQKILLYWIDAERYRRVTKREHRRFAFREIQATYLRSGSPRELPEIIKWASLCGWTPQGDRSSSFTIPKSITKRMYLSDSSLFSENVFLTGQKMALERLSIYWVPKYIQHKKILRKLIAEKRGVCSEFRAETRRFSPVPELDNPVSRTRSEQEIDDFMEAQCVSSTESVTETDEEIRARKLEEWKKWFWEGIDSQTGSEAKVEPPEDMPLELRQLGGITGDDDTTSAPPSSPVPPEGEGASWNTISEEEAEEESISDWSDAENHAMGYSLSFSHAARCRLVPIATDRAKSEPALPTFDMARWYHRKPKEDIAESEESDSLEEKRVSLPKPQPPYAQIPTSAPRKLKTLYEALASEKSIINEEQEEEEFYGSSSDSPSPNRSLSASPPPTVILELRRTSASRVIPLEDIGHEIASVVGEPRAVYPRESPHGGQFIVPRSDTDMHISNEFSLPALVALTADKLAGGPLREYLEKTEEHVALRSVQFWEDSQRYLTPPENFGSYSKYHSAKTLLATYIAPDSPRIMAMSPQARADLMRLLLQERGDHLLSTVVKASIQTVTLPWSEFVRNDEDHFVNCVGIRRKSANKKKDVKPDKTNERRRSSNDFVQTWQALKLAAGLGMSGFSLGQDDEDKDEREAHEENFQIPSLKEKESAENNGARGRRASHFYGHVTKQGEDTSEGNKKNGGTKIRPPKPRGFNDVLHDALQLMWFKRFLSEKNSEAPLLFWQAVENMKTNCKDGKARQARAMIITKKYFINIPSSSVEYLHCKADIIRDIPLLEKTTPPMLVSAQACVARSMEENWYADYVATFPEEESERENFTKYAMRNTLAGVYKMAAHGKTVSPPDG
ncbi:regulator of G-protein signaling [Desmophyllum pertusum]|uniref:Regulator of G-protein signaling n=1 Tax=Desmophyllum pertusum TaxID=174260 RepID=A0A9W9YEB7_9CNID|nr:regulator of G-protein signaling [Desmophyllum pertusum]